MKLYEKKGHLIRKNPNLTEEQKLEIIELLRKHPSYENKIDWNKNNSLTYKDFINILRPLYLNELDIRGLIEGEDYDLLLSNSNEQLYAIYTYNASKIIASNSVEPKIWTELPDWCGEEEFSDEAHAFGHFDSEHGDLKPGAKWCISMQTSDKYWKEYSEDFYFIFWIRDSSRLRSNQKIAISIDKKNGEIASQFNASDIEIDLELPRYIEDAISENFDNIKEKEKQLALSKLKLNQETGRYDYDGDLYPSILEDFVSEDKDGFTIKFGKIKGNFDCYHLGLTSLKGAPQVVGGDFYCQDNQLTSLEGAPQKVGRSFYCSYNQFTSLEGAPQVVGGDFSCSYNHLTSLEGAPQEIGGGFYCNCNQLSSLEGGPQIVGKGFYCFNNLLTSLEGAPQTVGWSFICNDNQLTSLKGAPKEVGGNFDCYNNRLTSLEGGPQIVGGSFDCYWNNISSLEGAPKEVGDDFDCRHNPNLNSLEGIGKVRGEVYKDF